MKATPPRSGGKVAGSPRQLVRRRRFNAFFLFASLGLAAFISTPGRAEILTNAAQILSLTVDRAAQNVPACVTGVVTVAQPDWAGRFYVQDESGGVFVELLSTNHPEPGDLVEVIGVTLPGAYAPMIAIPEWKKIGTAPLPEARKLPLEQLMSGVEDGQRVEVEGIVRSAGFEKGIFEVDLALGGYRLRVIPKPPTNTAPMDLVGCKVRVRGTAGTSFNASLRQMIAVLLFVPLPSDFVVLEKESPNPFQQAIVPLGSLVQYQRSQLPGKRVHVKGTVTYQRRGEYFFLKDKSGGLRVNSRQFEPLVEGEVVEAAGFLEIEGFLPVLADGVFHKTKEPRVPAAAKAVTVKEIQDGLHHADLITLKAKVLNRSFQIRNTLYRRDWHQTTLLLQQDDQVFTAQVESPSGDTAPADIPVGSTIEVTGVCFTEIDKAQQLQSLQMLIADSGDVRLLTRPSWFTPRRLLVGVVFLFAVLVGAVIWTLLVEKRNAVLAGLVREKEQAQLALQQVNEHLEDRVRERTAQLKFQITARKEAEVQFKGTLLERTRLAQELHDTLEQSLTGIALQLDTSAKLFQSKPETANQHLELARDQVAQSQVEVRRSIWDLRSRALEQFDLPVALATSSQQLTEGTNIQFKVTTDGRVRPLPEIVEENLLRIGQEAITNVIKHSRATAAEIHLDYGFKNITLRINDNGRGFEHNQCEGPAEGHFGLLGISERAKRLNAELTLQSEPGNGTLVMVRVGLDEILPTTDGGEL